MAGFTGFGILRFLVMEMYLNVAQESTATNIPMQFSSLSAPRLTSILYIGKADYCHAKKIHRHMLWMLKLWRQ